MAEILTETHRTHSEECYRWHHRCAIAEVERLRAAVAAEREACAKVCESEGQRVDASWQSCADAIRARGK